MHAVRFSTARRRITANVVVPASEVAAAGTLDAVRARLDELAQRVATRCAPGDDMTARALRGAFQAETEVVI